MVNFKFIKKSQRIIGILLREFLVGVSVSVGLMVLCGTIYFFL